MWFHSDTPRIYSDKKPLQPPTYVTVYKTCNEYDILMNNRISTRPLARTVQPITVELSNTENVNSISSLVCDAHRNSCKFYNPLQVEVLRRTQLLRNYTTYLTDQTKYKPPESFNQNDRVRKTNKEIYEHIYRYTYRPKNTG